MTEAINESYYDAVIKTGEGIIRVPDIGEFLVCNWPSLGYRQLGPNQYIYPGYPQQIFYDLFPSFTQSRSVFIRIAAIRRNNDQTT